MFNKKIILVICFLFLIAGCGTAKNVFHPPYPSAVDNLQNSQPDKTPEAVAPIENKANSLKVQTETAEIKNGEEHCLKYDDNVTWSGLCIVTQTENERINIFIRNKKPGFVTITLAMTLKNLESDRDLPYTAVLPPNSTNKILSLSKIEAGQETDYDYNLSWRDGSKEAKHNDSYVYTLPYAVGTSHILVQGYNSYPTHSGEEKYALDWVMDENTPVLAAREGIVTTVLNEFKVGDPDPSYGDKANFVAVQHADGTVGIYMHHNYHKAKVKVGDHVKVGQVLALAGCTGSCAAEHLHFQVQQPVSGTEITTIPTIFKIDFNKTGRLVEGVDYAVPGDKPLPTAAEQYGSGSLAALPDRLAVMVNSIEDRDEAAQALLDYLKNNQVKINQQWKNLVERSMSGDRAAQNELQGVMDCCLNLRTNKDFVKISNPDPYLPPATEEAFIIWDQLFAL